MRLVILVEGDTEERVLKDFLKPFCTRFTKVSIINFQGNSNLWSEFKSASELELENDPQAHVLCLIDLLEPPLSFPKYVLNHPDPYHAQYSYIQRRMSDQIDSVLHPRFHAFPIVMELETWLLGDSGALGYFDKSEQPRSAPENVLRPADELDKLMWRYKKRSYRKAIDGQSLFQRARAERIYHDKCPHFEIIINRLLQIQDLVPFKPTPEFKAPNEELYQQWAELETKMEAFWNRVDPQDTLSDTDCEEHDEIEAQIQVIKEHIAAEHRQQE